MGLVCCGRKNNIELEISSKIYNQDFPLRNKINSEYQLVTLIQTYYRSHLSINKFKLKIETLKEQISTQLDKKKLINNDIISECKSEKIYQKLLIEGKIKSYLEIVNNNKKIKKNLRILEKFSFFIPNYIVSSPTEVYKGSWNFNKKYHGYGVKYELNTKKDIDSRTEGTFNNGLLFGWGRIILSNNEIFVGNFVFGKMAGKGEFHRKDGSKYEGQFLDGVPHGKGKEKMEDGSIFEGVYFGGKRKEGKITWKDGSYYDGFFENDKFSGFGKYNWGNKRYYEGEWKEGKMNGKGKLTFLDGSYYEGEFLNGKKNGQGKYVWEENKFYIGGWKDDKQNGKGTYNKFGKETIGFWLDGHLFSKTLENFNILKLVRKKPTIGGFSIKEHKCISQYNQSLNESNDKFNSYRNDIKSEKRISNIKKNNYKNRITDDNTPTSNYSINNQEDFLINTNLNKKKS